jgi:hypothetical protein
MPWLFAGSAKQRKTQAQPPRRCEPQQITRAGPRAELLANLVPRFRPPLANLEVTALSPKRSASQMEVASFLLSKENQPEDRGTPMKKEHQKAWSLNLNGFDVEEGSAANLRMPQKATRTD